MTRWRKNTFCVGVGLMAVLALLLVGVYHVLRSEPSTALLVVQLLVAFGTIGLAAVSFVQQWQARRLQRKELDDLHDPVLGSAMTKSGWDRAAHLLWKDGEKTTISERWSGTILLWNPGTGPLVVTEVKVRAGDQVNRGPSLRDRGSEWIPPQLLQGHSSVLLEVEFEGEGCRELVFVYSTGRTRGKEARLSLEQEKGRN